MPNRTVLLTAALLAALVAAALAAAASVTIYADNRDAGNFTPVQFDEGKRPVYFVLWWPPDDAQWTTLLGYAMPKESDFVDGIVLSGVGGVYLPTVLLFADFNINAKPLVSTGAHCFYVYDPSVVRRTEQTHMGEMLLGYLVWCRAGVISVRAHGASRNYTLWVPVAAYSDGQYYSMRTLTVSILGDEPLRVDGDRFRVVLPEEGTVVMWNVVFPTYFSKEDYKLAVMENIELKKYDGRYRFWAVGRSRTAEVWPGSYLVVGIWPNGTVREWRFAARRLAWIYAHPPARVPENMAKFLNPGDPNLHSFGQPILTFYYDEGAPNFNDLVGDRGNGTAVLTLTTVPPNSWLNYSIVLLPDGMALYVVWDGRQYFDDLWRSFVDLTYRVIRGIHFKAPVNVSKGLKIGVHPRLGSEALLFVRNQWGYWPRGTEGTMLVFFDSGNGTYVAVIYDPVVYRNGTLVIKRYAVPSWTGCARLDSNALGVKYTNCSLADFFYDEWRFDVTPLRLPWLCPTCLSWRPTFNYTYPTEFAVRVTEIEDKFDPWIEVPGTWPPQWVKREYVLAARAPTVLSLARAYARYVVVNATRIGLWPHGWYLAVQYLEPTRAYLALVDAVATVKRLVP